MAEKIYYNGREIDGGTAADIARNVCERDGLDKRDIFGLMRRLKTEPEARETFADLTGIEVFV